MNTENNENQEEKKSSQQMHKVKTIIIDTGKIKQTKAPSFADIAVIDRRNKMRNTFLSQINQLVDWRPISNLLNKQCLKQPTTPMGAPSYPPLLLFKILLLET